MRLFLLYFIFVFTTIISAQEKEDIKPELPKYLNTIKWNPTPMILWSSKNLTFSYERILSPKNSITFTLGYLELPDLLSDSILGQAIVVSDRKKQGFNINAEYRFYLTKRNGRPIPDGIYLAPYISHYNYHFKNSLDLIGRMDSAVVFKGDLYALNVGFELGYQFVFKERYTLDLVLFGPSFSYYALNLGLSGNADLEDFGEKLNEDYYNRLKERFPAIGNNIQYQKDLQYKGRASAFTGGFRYLVQFGYRF